MDHCDPELLALRALGESVDPASGTSADSAHLAGCSLCQAELDQLRAVVSTSRSITPEDAPQHPSPVVWERITAELALPRPGRASGAHAVNGAGPVGSAGPLPRPRRWPALVLAAAVLGAVVGTGATLLATRDAREVQDERVLSTATLAPLRAQTATGQARLVAGEVGRELSVDVTGLAPHDGFYEVWLLDRDAKRLLSLGVLDGRRGSFPLPAGLDLSAFPVVDVSREEFDGDPSHSADSVVRGTLRV